MSAETIITGAVHKIMDIQQITDTFKKRDVVISTNGDYPQLITIQFVNDQTHLFDNILKNENVEIAVNIRGREWTSPQGEIKYFNTLQGWRVNQLDNNAPAPKPKVQGNIEKRFEDDAIDAMTEDDDLPF